MISREMNEFEEPITALDIRKETGLSKRMLEQVLKACE